MARRDVKYARKSQLSTSGGIDHTLLSNIGTNTHAQIDTHIADSTLHFTEGSIDHTAITNIGTNTHAQIDTHIADSTLHFTEGSIDHTAITNIGTNTHAQIDTHIALTNEHIDWTGASAGTIHATNYVDNDTTDHTAFSNIGTNTHAQIDTHLALVNQHLDWASASVGTIHATNYVDNDTTDHTALSNIGTNTHAQVDTHIADATLHFTEGSIDHGSIAGLADDDHTQYLLVDGTRALTDNLLFSDATEAVVDLTTTSATLTLRGRDSLAANSTLAAFNPNGAASLYYDGGERARTATGGLDVVGSNASPAIRWRSNADVQYTSMYVNNASGLFLDHQVTSGHVSLRSKDSGAVATTLLEGDPDGPVDLYYDGSISMLTTATGAAIRDTSGSVPILELQTDAGTSLAQLTHSSSAFRMAGIVHSDHVIITAEDAGGTAVNLFLGDPDAAAKLYYSGDLRLSTSATGFYSEGSSSTNSRMEFRDNAAVTMGRIGFVAGSKLQIYNSKTGGHVIYYGNNASAALTTLMEADPDGPVQLYYAGTRALRTHSTGFYVGTSTSVGTFIGSGTPESAVTAGIGSTFHRTDGGASTSFYVKESGTGNTGWVAK